MNKNIKKIIAVALTVSAISTVSPISNIMTTKAYASSSRPKLDDIYLSKGDISFDENDTSYDVKVKSSVDEIKVTAKPEGSDYKVKIDGHSVYKSDDYERTVSLDKGKNTITIRVEDSDGHTNTYTLNVRRGYSSDDYDNDNDNDDVYLENLDLNHGSIDFSKSDTSYDVKVDSDVDEIRIKAEPEDSDDEVRIDGSRVDDDDDWEKNVDLKKGKNKIKVEVEDDSDSDKTRTYTLNITRGHSSDGSSDNYLNELSISGNEIALSKDKTTYYVTTKESVDEVTVKADLDDTDNYLFINGDKVYESDDYEKKIDLNKGRNTVTILVKDVYGKELRTYTLYITRGEDTSNTTQTNTNTNTNNTNTQTNQTTQPAQTTVTGNWSYDRSTGKYYFVENGLRVTNCWKYINNQYYLFDSTGAMLTGWQLTNGKWYYMYIGGEMAHDTWIGGYWVGSDGAWVQ